MKTILALALALATASCATKHTPPPLPHVNIPRAKIVEEATNVRRSVDDVADSNGKIKGQLGTAKARADDLVSSGKELEAEFAALVSKEAITRAELATANRMWGKYFRDVQTMQSEVVRANDMVNEQAAIIYTLRQETTNMTVEAAKASQALDISIQQSESYAKHYNAAADQNSTLLQKLAVLEASNGKLKAWVIWLGGILLLYATLRILKLFPQFRPFLFWVP
jgi:chromosome segregation ATPase